MKLVWFNQPCGEGNHTEIIGSDYATCIKCRTVRRINWYQVGHKSYLEKEPTND